MKDTDNLKYLLKSIALLNQRIKDRENHEDRFNLFDIMFSHYDEVYLHSRFLSVLLDPTGSHKMKDTFLRLLLTCLGLTFKYNLTSLEVFPNERDRSEYKEIDILLIDRKCRSSVIIENKLFAPDSNHEDEGQLERYYRRIINEDGIPPDNISIIYLSLDREAPSDESIGTSGVFPELNDKVHSIHYGVEILDWLKACVKECFNKPMLRESINQYIHLIENMTNNSTSEEDIKSLFSIVGSNEDNLMSAKRLLDNTKHLHWWAIYEFWKSLSENLVLNGFTIRERIENEEIDMLVHGNRTTRKVYFNLGVTSPTGLPFTINADYEDFICLGVRKSELLTGTISKTKKFYKENCTLLALDENSDWPFFRYYVFEQSDGLCLSDFNDDFTFSLISPSNREKIVNEIINQSKVILNKYESYL